MKLSFLEISGFRGFAEKQSFDLSADATVIVGSNGLGKTCLLDAIHWGLCGRLGRLGDGDHNLVSMYSNTGQARVVLTLENGDSKLKITRIFDGQTQSIRASIGNHEYKETSAKARILETLWPEAASAIDGDEAFSLALLRSVYLQQDRLREFLEGSTGQERFNVISELVGAGRLTELQSQLESESRSWSLATTKKEKEVTPLINRVEELETKLASLRKSSEIGQDLQESQWSEWWKSLRLLEKSNAEIPKPTSADASLAIDNALKQITALRDRNRRRLALVKSTIEALESPPQKPTDDLEDLESKLVLATQHLDEAKDALQAGQMRAAEVRSRQLATREEKEQKRALAQLAIQLLEDKCPVCQQSYDVDGTRLRLQEIIESDDLPPPERELDDIKELVSRERDANRKENIARRKLADASQLQEKYKQWKLESQTKLSEIGVQDKGMPKEELRSLLQSCDELESLFKDQLSKGESLSFSIARASAVARMKSTSLDLEIAQNELKEQQRILRARDRTSIKTKKLIDQLRSARSSVVIDRLADIEPVLQRIFARIDPHPTFRAVKFATNMIRGKGCLDTEIRDELEDLSSKKPEAIFSSSQLNALAVSVFLSFNLALPNLPIQTAILDDPIQSLDDINLLGLVDLLRRTKDIRQIIVSTHDEKFGRLLARKLRPASESQSTSVIAFRGWERTGPRVDQYSIEADMVPFLLAANS